MNLGTLKNRLNKRYLAGVAAALAVAAIVCLWLLPSTHEKQLGEARRLLETGKQAFNANDTYTALSSLQKVIDLTQGGLNDTLFFEATVYNALLYEKAGESTECYKLLKPLKYVEVKGSLTSQFYLRAMAQLAAKLEKNYDKALRLVKQDVALCKKNHPQDKSLAYIDKANLCELYYMSGDKAKAWQEVRAFENSKLEKYQDLCLSEVYYVHSSLLFDEENTDSAYHYATLGEACAKKSNYLSTLQLNLQMKCRIDSARNDLQTYLKNRRSLDIVNAKLMTAEILAQTNLVKVQGNIDQLKSENERKQLTNMLLLGLLVVTALFFVLAVYTLRRKARDKHRMDALENERLDAEIQRKKLENQLLLFKQQDTEKKLDQAYRNNVNMSVKLAQLEEGMQGGDSLAAMENNLRMHHPDFLERLKSAYPHLTENDVRVLGFMHMGYTSKVIASALNITMSSLTTTRYRLKKKLNLAGNADLKDFVDAF